VIRRTGPGRLGAAGALLLTLAAAVPAGAGGSPPSGRDEAVHDAAPAPGTKRWERLPDGMLFPTLVADPRAYRNFLGLAAYDLKADDILAGLAGFGTDFPLFRRTPAAGAGREGEPTAGVLQIGVGGGVNALFDMDSTSRNLIDADFIIGLPVTWRRGAWALRGRYYHISAHQGDDFIFENETDIVLPYRNISFETLEAAAAWTRGAWTAYGVAGYIARTGPEIDGRWRLQTGLQGLWPPAPGRAVGWVGGLDLHSWSETGWDLDATAKLGLHLPGSRRPERAIQILLEATRGHVPYLQLYDLKVRAFGFGFVFIL
jgi:hypothetical protein